MGMVLIHAPLRVVGKLVNLSNALSAVAGLKKEGVCLFGNVDPICAAGSLWGHQVIFQYGIQESCPKYGDCSQADS